MKTGFFQGGLYLREKIMGFPARRWRYRRVSSIVVKSPQRLRKPFTEGHVTCRVSSITSMWLGRNNKENPESGGGGPHL